MTQTLITPDMTVGNIIKKYPQAAAVFQQYGLACTGCNVAHFETIQQGAMGHGMDTETFEMMLTDANEIATESLASIEKSSDELLLLTTAAANKIKEFISKEGGKKPYLRIAILTGGCAGNSYDLSLQKKVEETDRVIEVAGVQILIEEAIID